MSKPDTGRFMVVHMMGGATERFEKWPLHITILPWINTPLEVALDGFLRVTEDMRACRVFLGASVLGEVALYGEDEDIPVRPVQNSTPIGVMHGLLLGTFHNALEDRTYTGGGYNPHLTIRENEDPGEGAEVHVDTLCLVEYGRPSKRIAATEKLQDGL